ncbi:MAG: cadherin-like beta sandwich domain-containing protein [Lachnospiraceae bacterium]|nr:cadherin-like beta sandwich domain-containing protein [Lachnospiraceae bacterium]
MNKKMKQMLAGILLVCMLAVMAPAQMLVAMAASGKITFSDPSGAVGQEVSVNMKISSADGSLSSADVMLAYDASSLEFVSGNSVEGGAGSLRAHGGPDAGDLTYIVFAMKFKALKPGTSQVTIASQEVYDNNAQMVDISHLGNATVTITGEGNAAPAPADGLLTALSVAPGTLTPEFSPAVDSYSLNVGMDVEKVDVQAQPAEGATVTVEGSEGLQMGENTITIKVTAADGVTVKNYTISVTKSETGESPAAEPEVIEGVSLEAAAKAITILAPAAELTIPEGFTETAINIDGHKVTGWIPETETEPQYCIFYAANAAGEKNFYRYDLTEKTIQRYFQTTEGAGVTKEDYVKVAEDYNNLLKDYKIRLYIIIALAAVSVVLLILVFVLLASKNSGGRPGGRRPERERVKEEEDQEPKRRVMTREERYMLGEEDEEEAKQEAAAKERAEKPAEPSEKAAVPKPQKERKQEQQKEPREEESGDFEEIPDEEPDDFDQLLPDEEEAPMEQETSQMTHPVKEKEADSDDDFEFIEID